MGGYHGPPSVSALGVGDKLYSIYADKLCRCNFDMMTAVDLERPCHWRCVLDADLAVPYE